ncbi:tripartite motif-containing protein 16-like [Engraulis encrasicolus]|uniref:tripartite motif-containing protein 16-like n=1 Tax=Engraulis encrasicolus TaxID=184585 RepID=UPI002FD5C157
MAAESEALAQDQFSCAICLDLQEDPVGIPCGHSFCMDCISGCWDQEDPKGVYSCPQCRQTFTPRPVLSTNTILAELLEKLKLLGLQSAAAAAVAHFYAEPGEAECDVCCRRKRKAVKSCLVCLTSYCETHFRAHDSLFPGEKHRVVDASVNPEELLCCLHNEPLDVLCRTDQTCVCMQCAVEEHGGHDTVSVAAEKAEKQRKSGKTQREPHEIIKDKEKCLQDLRQAVQTLQSSADAAVESSEKTFDEMIRSIEKRRSQVTKVIRDQERADVSRAEELMETLELEIAELKSRVAELEQFSQDIKFFKSPQSMFASTRSDKASEYSMHSEELFEKLSDSLTFLKEKLQDVLYQGLQDITCNGEEMSTFAPSGPTTREEFLEYYCHLTLDPNTAYIRLKLSEENRVVDYVNGSQKYPDHPDRFGYVQQVMCSEATSARCYWELEWTGDVHIAVSYKGLKRKGINNDVYLGYNANSWSLFCSPSRSVFHHHNDQIKLPLVPTSSRIGVYVDHRAGTLSFYTVSDTMTLVHKVETTFTEPLYPAFRLFDYGNQIKLCQ